MTAEEIAVTRAKLPETLPDKKTRLKSAGLFLPPDQIAAIDAIAQRQNKSRNALMREAVVNTYLKSRSKKR